MHFGSATAFSRLVILTSAEACGRVPMVSTMSPVLRGRRGKDVKATCTAPPKKLTHPPHKTTRLQSVSVSLTKLLLHPFNSKRMEQDTLAMQPSSNYALVDSLYGPGTVIAWLLTTFSILINWTLHTKRRHEDTITVDLAATLVFPIVSAGHLISQIHRLSTPVSEVMTSTHIDDMGIVAAFEAPLNICETFSWVSLILVLPCIYWSSDPDEKEHLLHFGAKTRLKRFGLVTCVGLISLSMEVFLFATTTARGVQVGNTTLSRPYVFQSFILLVASWVFVIVCFCILGGGMLVHRLSERSSHGYKEEMRTDRVAVPIR
jgi:hypothetical protein